MIEFYWKKDRHPKLIAIKRGSSCPNDLTVCRISACSWRKPACRNPAENTAEYFLDELFHFQLGQRGEAPAAARHGIVRSRNMPELLLHRCLYTFLYFIGNRRQTGYHGRHSEIHNFVFPSTQGLIFLFYLHFLKYLSHFGVVRKHLLTLLWGVSGYSNSTF